MTTASPAAARPAPVPRQPAGRPGGRLRRLARGLAPGPPVAATGGAVAGWLTAGLLLLLVGWYRPVPVGCCCPPAAAVGAWLAWRNAPARRWPPLAVLATLVLVGGFVALSWLTAGQQLVLRRDPGSYALSGLLLAEHGRFPVATHAAVFGGLPWVNAGSPGFYQVGSPPVLVPQFMTGLPMLLAVGDWVGGLGGLLHVSPVLAGLALAAVAVLAGELVGPWAGPATALLLGATYPVLHTARSVLSEPVSQLLLFCGLLLLTRQPAGRSAPARSGARGGGWVLGVGGFLVGLSVLARIDGLFETMLLIPFVAVVCWRAGPRPATWLAVGTTAGAGLGLLDGVVVSRPYLASLRGELSAIAAAAVALAVAALVASRLRRRWTGAAGGSGWWDRRRLGLTCAVAVLVAAAAFAVRPLLQPRLYAAHSLSWLSWWVGVSGLLLAVTGLAWLVARAVAGRAPRWVPFLLVAVSATAQLLWRPQITPDHPWADRRFVPVVLPAAVLCVVWLAGRVATCRRPLPRRRRATGGSRPGGSSRLRRVAGRAGRGLLGAGVLAGLLVPAVITTGPLWSARTEAGELTALLRLCRALPGGAVVLATGPRAYRELQPGVRELCGVPVAGIFHDDQLAGQLPPVAAAVRRSGHRLVVLDMAAAPLRAAGLSPRLVVDLTTTEDARVLTRPPAATVSLSIPVWAAVDPSTG